MDETTENIVPTLTASTKAYPAPLRFKEKEAPAPPVLDSPKKAVLNSFSEISQKYDNFDYTPPAKVKSKEDYIKKSPRRSIHLTSFVETTSGTSRTKGIAKMFEFPVDENKKSAAVKMISGIASVKSMRPGAVSPTLLYGKSKKVDLTNSEVVVPENHSVKSLKSRWEASSSTGTPLHPDNKISVLDQKTTVKRLFEAPLDQMDTDGPKPIWKKDVAAEVALGPPMKATKTDTSLNASGSMSDLFDDSQPSEEEEEETDEDKDAEEAKDTIDFTTPTRTYPKFGATQSSEDRFIDNQFNFIKDQKSAVMSPFSDYRTPCGVFTGSSLMEDINTELNKFTTPKTHNKDRTAEVEETDSPHRKLVHSISFYRQKAKELEKESKDMTIEPTSENMTSSLCSGSVNSESSTIVEAIGDDFSNIEFTKNRIKKSIAIQQDQVAQSTRAIAYCRQTATFKGSREEVDAQRALLIANERRRALSLELEKIHQTGVSSYQTKQPRGTLAISTIAFKLNRDFIETYIKSQQSCHLYYFIALVKFGETVNHTQLVSSDNGLKNGFVEFPYYLQIKNLPINFVATVEIYSLKTMREIKGGKDVKGKMKTMTPFKKLTASAASNTALPGFTSPGEVARVIDPGFQIAGTLKFDISHVNQQSKNLYLESPVYPLERTIAFSMKCFGEEKTNHVLKGFLNLYQTVGELSSWNRYWCVLVETTISFWKYPEDEDTKRPHIIVDLNSCKGKVSPITDLAACFPNTLQMHVVVMDQGKMVTIRLLFAPDTLQDMNNWVAAINDTVQNFTIWCQKKVQSIV
uniref:PH domain-containing protein n=1 Tax=Rhabditophanes sp. KR3021 TaxID=114890 RepID=A0AC35TQW9_9BILA